MARSNDDIHKKQDNNEEIDNTPPPLGFNYQLSPTAAKIFVNQLSISSLTTEKNDDIHKKQDNNEEIDNTFTPLRFNYQLSPTAAKILANQLPISSLTAEKKEESKFKNKQRPPKLNT